ncbi:hypothetical protein EMCRGX_G007590 [Ephydatia muelleri]
MALELALIRVKFNLPLDLVYCDGLGLPQSSGQSSSRPRETRSLATSMVPHPVMTWWLNVVKQQFAKLSGIIDPEYAWVQIPFSLPRAQHPTDSTTRGMHNQPILHHYCGAFSFLPVAWLKQQHQLRLSRFNKYWWIKSGDVTGASRAAVLSKYQFDNHTCSEVAAYTAVKHSSNDPKCQELGGSVFPLLLKCTAIGVKRPKTPSSNWYLSFYYQPVLPKV